MYVNECIKVDINVDVDGINIVEPKPTYFIDNNEDITFNSDDSKSPHPHIEIHMSDQIQPKLVI